jgi:hypothetical protein
MTLPDVPRLTMPRPGTAGGMFLVPAAGLVVLTAQRAPTGASLARSFNRLPTRAICSGVR